MCGMICWVRGNPDSKVHWANMGPIWGRQDPGAPHVGPRNFATWVIFWIDKAKAGCIYSTNKNRRGVTTEVISINSYATRLTLGKMHYVSSYIFSTLILLGEQKSFLYHVLNRIGEKSQFSDISWFVIRIIYRDNALIYTPNAILSV